jgi:non-ribosomal peptide synthetase component F
VTGVQTCALPIYTAVVFEGQSLTYTELNARANQLAHVLIRHGVVADTLVGICVERSLEMVIGLLAILKAGGAYVPLDPSYPAERLAFMVQDSQVALLLTQTHLQGRLPLAGLNPPPLVCVDDPAAYASQPDSNPPLRSQPQDLAYVIYTSGSTGKPKGVCIAQHSVIRLVKNTNYMELNSEQVFLQYAPIAFDAATLEIWGALLNSARLIVTPPSYKQLEQLGQLIQHEQVTILWLTSSLFNVMIDEYPDSLKGVKYLLAGGETLSTSHVEKAIRLLPDTHLIIVKCSKLY